jgi:uncharacterized protein YjbJ (UPF0337 family)
LRRKTIRIDAGQAGVTDGEHERSRVIEMNQHRVAGNRKQLKGEVRDRSGRAPLKVVAGARDQLGERIQEPDGLSSEEAARQLDGFLDRNRDWDH